MDYPQNHPDIGFLYKNIFDTPPLGCLAAAAGSSLRNVPLHFSKECLQISDAHRARLRTLVSLAPETEIYASLENDVVGEDTKSPVGSFFYNLFTTVGALLTEREVLENVLSEFPDHKVNIFIKRDYDTIIDKDSYYSAMGSDLVDMHVVFPFHIITLYGKECESVGIYSEEERNLWENKFI